MRLLSAFFIISLGLFGQVLGGDLDSLLAKLSANERPAREAAQLELTRRVLEESEFSAVEVYKIFTGLDEPEARSRVYGILRQRVLLERLGPGHGFIGITMSSEARRWEAGNDEGVVKVLRVRPESPAERAGLKIQDRIVKIDDVGFPARNGHEVFQAYVMSKSPGDVIVLLIDRKGVEVRKRLVLSRFPTGLFPKDKLGLGPDGAAGEVIDEEVYFDQWMAKRLQDDQAKPAGE